ncbi:MAG TPA: BON domain-containing protein [Dehalococcoidia bacterium]
MRSDDEIRREIEGSLAVDAGLEGADVRVWVEDGVATLTGTVMSDEDRRRVEDLARSARGVRDVRNRVQTAG